MDYEIIESPSKSYVVLDYRKNVTVEIDIVTKIKVNTPSVTGEYYEASYPLYYKYDGALMIITDNDTSFEKRFTSYPLQKITN